MDQTVDYVGLSRAMGHNSERNLLLVSAEEDEEWVLEMGAEKGDLLLPLREYKVPKANLEGKQSRKDLILRATEASVKHLKSCTG